MADRVSVTVVYASPGRPADELSVSVPLGAAVQAAIDASGLAGRYPEQSFASLRLGIWGKIVDGDRKVTDGDRIEIYRPLTVDPKIARLRRAGKRQAGMPAK